VPQHQSSDDLLTLLLGERLGEGVSRAVYRHACWPDQYVVKVSKLQQDWGHDFQNIAEWELWHAAGESLRLWLAPCVHLSRLGTAMVQVYCEPCPTHLIPKKAPAILEDMHGGNWGVLNGRPVALDYGRHAALQMACSAKKGMRLQNVY